MRQYPNEERYVILRFFMEERPPELICSTNTEEAAKQVCSHPNGSSRTATAPALLKLTEEEGPWFVGYRDQDREEGGTL